MYTYCILQNVNLLYTSECKLIVILQNVNLLYTSACKLIVILQNENLLLYFRMKTYCYTSECILNCAKLSKNFIPVETGNLNFSSCKIEI